MPRSGWRPSCLLRRVCSSRATRSPRHCPGSSRSRYRHFMMSTLRPSSLRTMVASTPSCRPCRRPSWLPSSPCWTRALLLPSSRTSSALRSSPSPWSRWWRARHGRREPAAMEVRPVALFLMLDFYLPGARRPCVAGVDILARAPSSGCHTPMKPMVISPRHTKPGRRGELVQNVSPSSPRGERLFLHIHALVRHRSMRSERA
mmetsp:Transcript_6429/g.21156  ORF Transcript_6429/g.21156 Transcript_6429/m.21156 type:complete len:203 (+) Transcript_6429:821-1429(+)